MDRDTCGVRREMHTFFFMGGRKERDYLEEKLFGEFNIEVDLEDEGWEGMDWIHLAQDRDRLLAQ